MSKGLFCYTTTIDDHKTVAEIEKELAKAGASRIMKEMGQGGHVKSLSFTIKTEKDGQEIPFHLPMDVDRVMSLVQKHSRDIEKRKALAYRVGWRIILYWVKAQCAIIETRMVTLEQVFLPYIQLDGKGGTLFDKYKLNRERMLQLED